MKPLAWHTFPARGRWLLAAAGGLVVAAPASAFYWVGWPGSGVAAQRTLLDPTPTQRSTNGDPSYNGGNGAGGSTTGGTTNMSTNGSTTGTTTTDGTNTSGSNNPGQTTTDGTNTGGDNGGVNPAVPEPATGVAALMGLSALAASGFWKKKRPQE